MKTFSAELRSSASSKLYPQNTTVSFTNFIPDQINLEGQYERALTENCCPWKLLNITEGSFGSSVTKGGKVIDSEKYKNSPS